jgi:hypothetical protein
VQQQTYIPEHGSQSPRDIEARLERDRNDVLRAFTSLRERLSPQSLMDDAVALISTNAGNYTQSLDRAIRANPVALAISAVGLAWLILGRRKDDAAETPTLAGTRYEAVTRWEDEGGPVLDRPPVRALQDDWTAEADRLRDRAAGMLRQINAATRRASAPVAELALRRAEVMAALTSDVRRVMGHGLEGMADATRHAALTARERAYELHLQARRKTAEALHERPLTSAAAIAVAGATLAAVLPRSSFEDRILGQTRDQIVAELERVLRDERQRIAGSVQDAAQGLMTELSRPMPALARSDSAAGPHPSVVIPS